MKDCEEIRVWYDEYRKPKEDNRIKYVKSDLKREDMK